MKEALVLTRWIGDASWGNPRRPDLPEGFSEFRDVTGQSVDFGSPSPNIVLVEVVEAEEEHKGYIDRLKRDPRWLVLDDLESARAYLKLRGAKGNLANADPVTLVRMCKSFERTKPQSIIERTRGMFYE